MQTALRRRLIAAAALSVVAHVVTLVELARYGPDLNVPYESAGPPIPIIPVILAPRAPPSAREGERPVIRLHRRRLRHDDGPLPIEPLIIDTPPPLPPPPPPPTPPRSRPAPPLAPTIRVTLRATVGCANPDAVGLTREERLACEQRLARGPGGVNNLALPTKTLDFGQTGARQQACRDYRNAGVALPGLAEGC